MSVSISRLQGRLQGKGRKAINARRYLSALETAYNRRMRETGQYVRAMRHEGSNEGRGQVDHVASAINATEVRASERMRIVRNDTTSSDLELLRDTLRNYRPRADQVFECRAIIVRPDRLAYGATVAIALAVQAGSAWRVVEAPATERTAKRTARKVSASDARRDRLMAIVGTADTDGILAQ